MAEAGTAIGCPSEDLLERIAAGAAAEVEVSTHVLTCGRCAGRLAEIEADNALVAEFRSLGRPAARWSPHAGDRLGSYRIGDEIGRGGQGIVFEAHDERTGRTVALKMLRQGQMATSHLRRRFEREIEIVAALRHPGIVTLYEAIETPDGSRAIAMEFVDGVPLDRWCAERRELSNGRLPADVLDVLVDVCDAVEHAHLRGVIHRDLKPSNILVDREGRPRVLDFGIAKLDTQDLDTQGHEPTLTTGFVGSPAYAAPEQILGASDRVDLRADLFALGAIAYQSLCGQLPFPSRGKVTELASAVRDEPLPELPSRYCAAGSRTVSRDLDAVLRKALAAEPERRYRSVSELRDDLVALRDGEPVNARPDTISYLLRRAMRRHRVAVAATIGVAGVLVSSTTAAAALWRSEANRSRYELSMDAMVSLMNAVTPDANVRTAGALTETEQHRIRTNVRAYEELIERASGDPARQADYCHGWAHLLSSGLGDHEAALVHARKAAELRAGVGDGSLGAVESLELVTYIAMRLGRYGEARATVGLIRAAIGAPAFPNDRRAQWQDRVRLLGTVLDSAEQARTALPHVREALDALEGGDMREALEAIEKATKELPKDADPAPLGR